MRYMLDTNICIFSIKNKSTALIQRLSNIDPSEICISSITLSEMYYGVYKSQAKEKNLLALEKMLTSIEVVSFDSIAAQAYGEIRAAMEKTGNIIGPLDFLIAAHALSLKSILITNNISEFKRVKNLKVEDWTLGMS